MKYIRVFKSIGVSPWKLLQRGTFQCLEPIIENFHSRYKCGQTCFWNSVNDNFGDGGTFAEPLPPSLPSSPQLPDLPDFDDDIGDGDGENDDDLESLFESIQPVAKETAKADPSKRRLNQG